MHLSRVGIFIAYVIQKSKMYESTNFCGEKNGPVMYMALGIIMINDTGLKVKDKQISWTLVGMTLMYVCVTYLKLRLMEIHEILKVNDGISYSRG